MIRVGVVLMSCAGEVDIQYMYIALKFVVKSVVIVSCSSLNNPNNGMINCSLGDDGMSSYDDTCSFTCNIGYELTGSTERTCQSDGSWSGSPVSCIIMECSSSSLPMNSMLAESCSSQYQSTCELECQEGFTGIGDPLYMCDVVNNGSSVMWMADGVAWRCRTGYNHLKFCNSTNFLVAS